MEPPKCPDAPCPDGTRPTRMGGARRRGRPKNVITSLFLNEDDLEALNRRLQAKLRVIENEEKRWEEVETPDAELLWWLTAP